MVRSHVHDLLGDGDDGLVLLDLEFADAEVGETSKFEGLQLLHALLELIGVLILSQEIVGHVTEVKVPIDFLVDLGCFNHISTLEKFACSHLKCRQKLKFGFCSIFVEVGSVFNSKQTCCKSYSITLLECLILVEEVAGKVCVQLLCHFCCRHSDDRVLFHGLE